MSIVELRGAEVTYRRAGQPFVALHPTDVVSEPGERVGVVGGSGSGKTTMARLMLGLVPPSQGDALFDDRSIVGLPERQRGWLRARASMVFQDPNSSLNPRMRVGRIIAEPLHRRATAEEIDEALSAVDLDPRLARRFPHQRSGGQRQRISIARALATRPRLLICDEPTSALDVSVQAQILNLLKDLQDELNLTMLFISHDLPVIRQMCDRIGVMKMGQLLEVAPTEQLFTDPQNEYSKQLISLMPEFTGLREDVKTA